jgi:hypothetical protein
LSEIRTLVWRVPTSICFGAPSVAVKSAQLVETAALLAEALCRRVCRQHDRQREGVVLAAPRSLVEALLIR